MASQSPPSSPFVAEGPDPEETGGQAASGWSLPAAIASALHALLEAVQQHEAHARAEHAAAMERATRGTAELREEVGTLRARTREQAGELAALGEQLALEAHINTEMAEAARRHAEQVEQILLQRRAPTPWRELQDGDPATPALETSGLDVIGPGSETVGAPDRKASPHREPAEPSSARDAVSDTVTGREIVGTPATSEALVEIVLKLPTLLLLQYDRLVDAGQYRSRDEAIRVALTSAILSRNARLASAAAGSPEGTTAPRPSRGSVCPSRRAGRCREH
jgi:Arc/MetJ-type ribon-helix-helix transcriptional regulator